MKYLFIILFTILYFFESTFSKGKEIKKNTQQIFKKNSEKKIDSINYYIRILTENPNKIKRRYACYSLKKYIQYDNVIKALYIALNDYDIQVQKNCIRTLKYIKKPVSFLKKIIQKITLFTYSKDTLLAKEAILTLGKIGAKDISYILLEKLSDERITIQLAAIWALCQIKNPSTLRELIKKLFDSNPTIRRYTALWISNFRDTRVIRFLKYVYKNDKDLATRQSSALSLRKFGIDKNFPKTPSPKSEEKNKSTTKQDLFKLLLNKDKN